MEERVVGIRVRLASFFIDCCIVNFIRSVYVNFFTKIFGFPAKFALFYAELRDKTGLENMQNISSEHIEMFLSSKLFPEFVGFLASLFLLSILYNFICFYFKRASLGQMAVKCHIVSDDGNKASVVQLLFRSFLIMIPWIIMFLVVSDVFMMRFSMGFLDEYIRAIILLISITWYDMIFFGKKRLLGHDVISKTKLVFNNPESGGTYIEKIIPDPIASTSTLFKKTGQIAKAQYESMSKFMKEAKDIIKGKNKK
ncbi:MAG: RDD family protein [Rickettsiales bacterium]|jgi:uncharacterized RDD family membrane protein YckC|nr:RDD family protein [Rickettsiales bacterium]